MENKSIWLNIQDNNKANKLNKDIEVDIAIIGGGISGLSAAYFLKDCAKKVCVLEKNKVGQAITSKTTGKITFLQDGMLTKISNIYDELKAYKYYNSQKDAINLIKDIIESEKIECDFTRTDSYLFTNQPKEVKKIIDEKILLGKFKESVEKVYELPDEKILYGIKCSDTYVFHPLKYLYALKKIISKNINIYEDTKVCEIKHEDDHYILLTEDNVIVAKTIVLCTHYPSFLFPYLMPLKCSLEKSYIALFKDATNNFYSAITYSRPTTSIRYVLDNNEKYKLILKKSHNICVDNNEKENFKELYQYSNMPDYLWSNIDVITKDYMPYIGLIDNNFFMATGFNTWGMTNGTLSGKIISDLIITGKNKYAKLFDPKRKNNFKTIIKYPLYAINSIYSFSTSKIIKNKKWYDPHITFSKLNGINVGIYNDEKGKSHIVKNKCPHLGCSLIFNEVEHTWDCPCHGSRFNIDGKCIEGPSNYDISL